MNHTAIYTTGMLRLLQLAQVVCLVETQQTVYVQKAGNFRRAEQVVIMVQMHQKNHTVT